MQVTITRFYFLTGKNEEIVTSHNNNVGNVERALPLSVKSVLVFIHEQSITTCDIQAKNSSIHQLKIIGVS